MNSQNLTTIEGDSLSWGRVSPPPPPLNLYVLFHFYVMMKGIEKSLLGILSFWSFWTPFKRILETISPISSLWTESEFTCGRGGLSTPGKVSLPPPPFYPYVCFHFYVMIKVIEKSLVIWSFWKSFNRILKTISPISSVEGEIYPRLKCPPPQPSCMLSVLCYDKGIEKSLVIWSFWMPFKRILETISHISSLWIVRIYLSQVSVSHQSVELKRTL